MDKIQETIAFIKGLYPNQDFIPLHEPRFFGNERKYVLDTLDSTFVSSVGQYVNRFEEMMQVYTGAKYAIAVVNGTAALHLGLKLVGVKADDLVITQALSFVATCNAIAYLGAEPAFIDVDEKRMGMSADSLELFLKDVELINGEPTHLPTKKRIGACVPMHTFGFPVKIDRIVALCDILHIPVVEDAAESLGSRYKDKHTGTYGKVGTFSFNGNKTITCGGGGIIVTDDEEIATFGKHLSTQAKVPHKWEFVHDEIGFNYRCPNLNAALACAQIEQLDSFVANKRETAEKYRQFFSDKSIDFLTEPGDSKSNYWLNSVMLENLKERNEFLEQLNTNGVMSRPVWSLMTELKMFKDCFRQDLTNSEKIAERVVNIPSSVRI